MEVYIYITFKFTLNSFKYIFHSFCIFLWSHLDTLCGNILIFPNLAFCTCLNIFQCWGSKLEPCIWQASVSPLSYNLCPVIWHLKELFVSEIVTVSAAELNLKLEFPNKALKLITSLYFVSFSCIMCILKLIYLYMYPSFVWNLAHSRHYVHEHFHWY